jgi:NADH:ubiquinone oxidoreductase subunit
MKSALISLIEIGRVCDVVEQGNEFETTSDFKWIPCPEDTTSSHTYDEVTNTFIPHNPLLIPGFAEEGYRVARQIAYKSVGEQMDMMFKELAQTGTISADGPWATHIASVKDAIPKDNPEAVMEWNKKHAEQMASSMANPLQSLNLNNEIKLPPV